MKENDFFPEKEKQFSDEIRLVCSAVIMVILAQICIELIVNTKMLPSSWEGWKTSGNPAPLFMLFLCANSIAYMTLKMVVDAAYSRKSRKYGDLLAGTHKNQSGTFYVAATFLILSIEGVLLSFPKPNEGQFLSALFVLMFNYRIFEYTSRNSGLKYSLIAFAIMLAVIATSEMV